MTELGHIDKRELETLFRMEAGRVLNFTNGTFTTFFKDHSTHIDSKQHSLGGDSTVYRLRNFLEKESDATVGKILRGLIEAAEYLNSKGEIKLDEENLASCKAIVARLLGEQAIAPTATAPIKKETIEIDFSQLDFSKLPIEDNLVKILEVRIKEAHICLENKAPLAAIFQAGSVLEGLLLGLAMKHPEQFNKADGCPKDSNKKPKEFNKWLLNELINVSKELGFLSEGVRGFSETLREFRNYIHPYEQIQSRFTPDLHTAKLCVQVMLAAISYAIEFSSRNKADALPH